MTARIFDGKRLAFGMRAEIKSIIEDTCISPCAKVIFAGGNRESEIYTKLKREACREAGADCEIIRMDEEVSENEVLEKIRELNCDPGVHGILVQLPLPGQILRKNVSLRIAPEKDADGFHPLNLGRIFFGIERLAPCTPKAIVKIAESEGIMLKGKHTVIINNSALIGKPLALMMSNRGATVTVCHSGTKNLSEHTKNADIIATAAGAKNLLKPEMIKEGCVVFDASGDCSEGISDKAGFLTPTPGGVGPMTVAYFLKNLLECYKLQVSRSSSY